MQLGGAFCPLLKCNVNTRTHTSTPHCEMDAPHSISKSRLNILLSIFHAAKRLKEIVHVSVYT